MYVERKQAQAQAHPLLYKKVQPTAYTASYTYSCPPCPALGPSITCTFMSACICGSTCLSRAPALPTACICWCAGNSFGLILCVALTEAQGVQSTCEG